MSSMFKPRIPDAPKAPPPPSISPEKPKTLALPSDRGDKALAKARGRSALRIDLTEANVAAAGTGLNIPRL